MADIVLTPEQQLAATDRRGPLLVSAAAGSGKTRVLVERLFDAMLRQGHNVDDYLIITYTKAAAAELRGKIAAELSRRLAAGPEDPHLRRQMFRVYQADIKTVDAFCAALLRQSVHLLPPVEGHSLTPDFRVLDEPESELLRLRVLQRVLDRFYEKLEAGDGSAALLAETLGAGRDDRALEALVLQLHRQIQSHPYPLRWLRRSGESWRDLPADLAASPYGREILKGTVRRALFWADRLERELRDLESWPTVLEKYGPAFSSAAAGLRRWAAAADRGWDAMSETVPAFEKLASVRDKEAADRKDRAKDLYGRCRKEVSGPLSAPYRVASAEHLADLRAMAPAVEALIALTEDFTAAYQAEKVRRNCMDFSDQEHYAIAVLVDENGTPTDLAAQISQRYREVMVDEYQDSNDVQDLIFRAVSDGGRRFFAVGDVKQSIYRFRLANPAIFLEKYDAWPPAEEAEEGQPRKVLLQQNFRSRPQVLDAANFIFGGVMSRELGELDYGEDERLRCGADYYLPRTDPEAELHLLAPEGEEEEETVDRTAAEAAYVARMVRRMLDEGYPIQEGEGFRPARPEDIVILMRSPSSRKSAYAAAMARERVPFDADESDDFFSTVEIAVIFSFLQIVDNPRQDVPLISVLRSPLLGFTPDRLAAIRAGCPAGDFYDALAADGGADTAAFLALLDRLRAAARELLADRLLWQLYTETDALAVFGAMEGGQQRKNNLIAFFTYAGQMSAAGRSGLFDFVTYLRRLLEQGRAPNPSTRQGAGGVRLMSIHRSKGLEFPVVILADLQRAFNLRDLSQPVLVHPRLGLGPDCVDRDRGIRYATAAKTAVATALERESKSEEMRILYVAMTRAKEKLILVDCMKNARTRVRRLADMASYPADPEAAAQCACLGDWVLLALLSARQGAPLRRWAEREGGGEYVDAPAWTVHIREEAAWAAPAAEEEGQERPHAAFDPAELERQYAYGAAARIPSKVTATELKGREKDREIAEGAPAAYRSAAFRRPRFLQGDRRLTGAERGTAMHLAMQFVELREADEAAVASQVADLKERRLMTPEQAEAVDCAAIAAFLRSPLGRRAAAAEQVYREYRFALLMDASLYDAAGAGEELLLQGVVDCAFDTPEGLVIVDFKTDRIAPGSEAERAAEYRPQLEAYAAALSRVLERPVAEKRLWFFATGRDFAL